MKSGYSNLLAVLIISALLISGLLYVLGSTANSKEMVYTYVDGMNAVNIAESCVEDEILYMTGNLDFKENIVLPEGECSAVLISNIGGYREFKVTFDSTDYPVNIIVSGNLNLDKFEVTRWEQVAD